MPVDVRVLSASELERAYAVLEGTFGAASHPDDVATELGTIDPARFYGAWDGVELVATAGSFDFSMTVPGGRLPVAGVTWVGVLATHRRQGVLTALMDRQLADLRDSGTPVAALWASQSAIYGRYGYGPASWRLALAVPGEAAFRTAVEPGRLRLVAPGCERYVPPTRASPARPPAGRSATTRGGTRPCTTRSTAGTAPGRCCAWRRTAATRCTPPRRGGRTGCPPERSGSARSWPRRRGHTPGCGGTCSTST